jgi:hypothetical protein
MDIPTQFKNIRQKLSEQVSFGCGSITLFALVDMQQAQVGYSVSADGSSVCSRENGSWRPNWLVIGYEAACGDPIFIDTSAQDATCVHRNAWRRCMET